MEWFIVWLLMGLMEWLVEWIKLPTEWLKEWLNPIVISGVLSGVATFIIAFITMKSMKFTERSVSLTEELVKSTDKPRIVVSLRPDELNLYLLMLHIENVGTGIAYNVKFKTDFDRKPDGEIPLGEIHFLKHGLPNLKPHLQVPHFLLSVLETENYEKQKQESLRIKVTYQGSTNQKYKDTFDLDFGMWEGSARVGSPPSVRTAKAREGIQTTLNNFMRGSSPPLVLTRGISEHRLLEGEKMVLNRMRYLPQEVQWELLQELSVSVAQKERENPKANRNSFFKRHTSQYNVT